MEFKPTKFNYSPNRKPIRGLGDVVKKLIEPIEYMVPERLREKMQNCGGCKKRQEALNKLLPNPFLTEE